MRKPLRCRLGWHKWAKRYNDQGLRYPVCSRCKKEGDSPDYIAPGGVGWG